jgi:PAS domain S-box-containing protein
VGRIKNWKIKAINDWRFMADNSSDKFLQMVDLLPGYIAFANATTLRYEFVNKGYETLFGIPRDKMIGAQIKDIIGETNYQYAEKFITEVKTGKAVSYENVFDTASGKRWIQVNYSPIFDAGGCVETIALLNFDITERKQTEEVLRQSESRLNAILSSMNDIVFEIDLNNCFEGYFAPENKGLYVQPEKFIGQKFDKILPEDVCVLLRQAIESINSGNPYQQFEYQLTVDNMIEWEHAVITPRYNNLKEFVGVTAVCRNITERKKTEEVIRNSEERLSAFMNSASDSFYLLDSGLNFIEINKRGLEIIGNSRENIIGKNIADIVPDVEESGRREKHLEVIRTGKPYINENFIPHPKFGNLHIVLTSFKVGDGLGVIAHDITERKQAENALRLSEAKFSILFHMNPSACGLSDMESRKYIEANTAFYDLFGFTKDEVIGKTAFDLGLFSPETSEAILKKADKEGKISNAEADLKAKSGEIIHVLLSAENIILQDKKWRNYSAHINWTLSAQVNSHIQPHDFIHEVCGYCDSESVSLSGR